ncbi:MAG: hypothetical protein ACO3JL_13560, partial [Myxococcota bacterium]
MNTLTQTLAVSFFVVGLSPQGLAASDTSTVASGEVLHQRLEAAVAAAKVTHPGAEGRLMHLEGLTPEHYLARRRAEPEAARELTRLVQSGEVPAVLLADLLLRRGALDAYPFSSAARFPKRSAEQAQRLIAQEREQLISALLLALAKSADPFAVPAIASVLLDEGRPLAARQVAATALGHTRAEGALTPLRDVALAEKTEVGLRTAAFAGLGSLRSVEAVAVLTAASAAIDDDALLRAVALAIGSAGSRSAHGDSPEGELVRRAASEQLVALLPRARTQMAAEGVVEALSAVAYPGSLSALQRLADDDRAGATV